MVFEIFLQHLESKTDVFLVDGNLTIRDLKAMIWKRLGDFDRRGAHPMH